MFTGTLLGITRSSPLAYRVKGTDSPVLPREYLRLVHPFFFTIKIIFWWILWWIGGRLFLVCSFHFMRIPNNRDASYLVLISFLTGHCFSDVWWWTYIGENKLQASGSVSWRTALSERRSYPDRPATHSCWIWGRWQVSCFTSIWFMLLFYSRSFAFFSCFLFLSILFLARYHLSSLGNFDKQGTRNARW